MSNSFFDPDGRPKVTVPGKRVRERWEFFYGGDVPVKEGSCKLRFDLRQC